MPLQARSVMDRAQDLRPMKRAVLEQILNAESTVLAPEAGPAPAPEGCREILGGAVNHHLPRLHLTGDREGTLRVD